MSNKNDELKSKSELENSFEEWWAENYSYMDDKRKETASPLVKNFCGMIKVIAKAAYLAASEPYVDFDALDKK